MKILNEKRCIIGKGPIWNEFEQKLYFTNGFGNEICIYDIENDKLSVFPSEKNIAAFAFSKDKRMIVSRLDGIFYSNPDGTTDQLYDTAKHQILYRNDMDFLAITTSSRRANFEVKTNADFTILVKMETDGRKPYLFG